MKSMGNRNDEEKRTWNFFVGGTTEKSGKDGSIGLEEKAGLALFENFKDRLDD